MGILFQSESVGRDDDSAFRNVAVAPDEPGRGIDGEAGKGGAGW